ncbi:adenylate kinase 8 [Suricata suricatta]|uniref:adenylate kinase 8 n=1 Tax=Suricata suricatta TaxID=37032 RepID=UPI0011557A7F|nr:adenylate kinase 8 [Suricata suricatta]
MDATTAPHRIPPEMPRYGEENHIFELMQNMLEQLLIHQPQDPILFMISHLQRDNMNVPRIVILGPPASGKTTIAMWLCKHLNTNLLTVENLVIREYSSLAADARRHYQKTKTVPSTLLIRLVQERVSEEDCVRRGWILDGIPETREQALMIQTLGIAPRHVIVLSCPDTVLIERNLGKRIDPQTGEIYHATFDWPPEAEVQNRLMVPEGISELETARRLLQYHRNITRILPAYPKFLKVISADQPCVDVFYQGKRTRAAAMTKVHRKHLKQVRVRVHGSLGLRFVIPKVGTEILSSSQAWPSGPAASAVKALPFALDVDVQLCASALAASLKTQRRPPVCPKEKQSCRHGHAPSGPAQQRASGWNRKTVETILTEPRFERTVTPSMEARLGRPQPGLSANHDAGSTADTWRLSPGSPGWASGAVLFSPSFQIYWAEDPGGLSELVRNLLILGSWRPRGGQRVGSRCSCVLDSGMFPDTVIMKVLGQRLDQQDSIQRGWVLHGFPRDLDQAHLLDGLGYQPNRVFFLNVPLDSIIERLTLRRTDPITGERYHLMYKPPPTMEIQARLLQHPKDTEEQVKLKMDLFYRNSSDLEQFYRTAITLNGDQDPYTVFEYIESGIINPLPKKVL